MDKNWLRLKRQSMGYIVLLSSIFLMLLVTPFLEGKHNPALIVVFGMVMFSAINVARFKRWHLTVGAILGLLWLTFTILEFSDFGTGVRVPALFFYAALVIYSAVIILFHIVQAERVGLNIISGGVAVFFLIGIAWAAVYATIETVTPGALHFPPTSGEPTFSRYIYYSFSSLTTLGYGDVYPISRFARVVSVLEASTGLLYIGAFIARLISLFKK